MARRMVQVLPTMALPMLCLLGATVLFTCAVVLQQAWWVMALLAVLLALLWWGMALRASLRRVFTPWDAFSQALQQRTPGDLRAMAVPATASADLQALMHALNQLLVKAQQERDVQQRFIADAAHQMRTPLAALQSQVEAWALMAQSSPEKSIHLSAEQVEHLRKASRRTTQLAHQLLALSRVESGLHQDTELQRVDLKSLCEALLESFWEQALRKKIDLGLEVDSAHVTGHAWLLRELLVNLLDNAIKYVPSGGLVTLRCGRRQLQPGVWRAFLEVEDDGPGVPESEYARLTQRFYRSAPSDVEGTGLGLAIAQEIAQGHGATLSFSRGKQSRGLVVTVVFTT